MLSYDWRICTHNCNKILDDEKREEEAREKEEVEGDSDSNSVWSGGNNLSSAMSNPVRFVLDITWVTINANMSNCCWVWTDYENGCVTNYDSSRCELWDA